MTALLVVCASLLLQIGATISALRLVPLTTKAWPWIAVALATALMAVRRVITLADTLGGSIRPDLAAEVFALLIAALLVAGLVGLRASLVRERRSVGERRRTEERLANLVEQASDGIFLAAPNGRYIEVNRRGCEMLGYTRDELLRMDLTDLVVPAEQATLEQNLGILRQAGRSVTERELRRKDGSRFSAEISSRLLDDGTLQGIVRDVSERKRAADALQRTTDTLRALFDSAPVAITVLDPDGMVSVWNVKAEAMFGWKAEEVLGHPLPIVPPDGEEQHQRFRQHLLAGDAGTVGAVVRRLRKDGTSLTVRLDTAPVRASDGTVSGTMGILVDLSEQVALEERLRQGQKMEAIGQLAGGIAHDFNNLLTAVAGYAELLQVGVPPGSTADRQVGHILAAARRAAELTQQLLAFGRRQVLQPRVIDLRRVVADVVPLLDRLLGENIALQVTDRDDVPPVLADPTQLQQVVLNLAVNARDAMPGGGTLTIEVTEAPPPSADEASGDPETWSSWVALRVRDTGEGIPEKLRKQIFEPFFTTKEHGRGTGLGLATVYGIVRQSGGVIRVRSRMGEGSTFTVLLPAASGALPQVAAPAGDEHVALARGTERLLVVEDEAGVRDLVIEVLRSSGYRVTAATSAEEALELVRTDTEPIDLLVTDVVLPHMDGRQLAHALREQQPVLKVLFMSGYADTSVIEPRSLGPGEHFMQKPFHTGQLATRVREAIDGVTSSSPGDAA